MDRDYRLRAQQRQQVLDCEMSQIRERERLMEREQARLQEQLRPLEQACVKEAGHYGRRSDGGGAARRSLMMGINWGRQKQQQSWDAARRPRTVLDNDARDPAGDSRRAI